LLAFSVFLIPPPSLAGIGSFRFPKILLLPDDAPGI
jgi:hypothetical protein